MFRAVLQLPWLNVVENIGKKPIKLYNIHKSFKFFGQKNGKDVAVKMLWQKITHYEAEQVYIDY